MLGLYVINSLEGGGAERVFAQLIELLHNDHCLNHHFEVILLDNKEIKFSLPKDIKVHTLGSGSKYFLMLRFIQLIYQLKPAYVLSFLTRSNNLNIIASLFVSYQAIISERSNTNGRLGKGLKGWVKRFLVKRLYKKAALVIAVSQGVKECLIKDYHILEHHIEVLNNPYDIAKIKSQVVKNKSHNSQSIIAMGRLVASKGFDTLIKAYARSGLTCGLQILGQGPELNVLQQLAIDLKIPSQVQFLGFQSKPYEYIDNALFFVLPSKLEGFPNGLVEAMALAKAVIATDCHDGPREILKLSQTISKSSFVNAEFGLMVAVDDVEGLSCALLKLSDDSKIRHRLEQLSANRALDFNSETFYKHYLCILKNNLNHFPHEKCTGYIK